MWKSGQGKTTQIGCVNRNRQQVMGTRGVAGTDHCQYAYKTLCQDCGFEYGANGSDLFLRKCPRCQGGASGIDY